MTIPEEIEAIRRMAEEGYAKSDIEKTAEALADLLDLLGRIVTSNIELKVIRVSVVDIKKPEEGK